MELLKPIKAVVTSPKWKDGKELGLTITIPKFLAKDFVKYGYGHIVAEDPEHNETPEAKEIKRIRKTKIKE